MRYIYYSVLFIIIQFVFLSLEGHCQTSNLKNEGNNIITIDLDSMVNGDLVPLDSIYSGYSYIIDKHGEYYNYNGGLAFGKHLCDERGNFILFDDLMNIVQLYDRNGNFIRYVGNKGIHPSKGEYSPDGAKGGAGYGVVYIVDADHPILQKYSYGGAYIGGIPILTVDTKRNPELKSFFGMSVCDDIIPMPDGKIVVHYAYWSGNLPYNYCVISKNGTVISKRKTMGDANSTFSKSLGLFQSRYYYYNKHLYVKDLSDTIYLVKDNMFLPKYVFKHKNSFSEVVHDFGSEFSLKDLYNAKRPINVFCSIQETKNYLFFSYFPYPPASTQVNGYYDKRSRKTYKTFPGILSYKKRQKFNIQKDTSDFVYPSIPDIEVLSSDYVIGTGKFGRRIKLYVK